MQTKWQELIRKSGESGKSSKSGGEKGGQDEEKNSEGP